PNILFQPIYDSSQWNYSYLQDLCRFVFLQQAVPPLFLKLVSLLIFLGYYIFQLDGAIPPPSHFSILQSFHYLALFLIIRHEPRLELLLSMYFYLHQMFSLIPFLVADDHQLPNDHFRLNPPFDLTRVQQGIRDASFLTR